MPCEASASSLARRRSRSRATNPSSVRVPPWALIRASPTAGIIPVMAATREPGRLGAVLDQAEVDRGRLDSAAVGTFSLTTLGVASVVGAGIFVTTFLEHTPLLLLDEPTCLLYTSDAADEEDSVDL